jgi:hypothetical protein
MHGSYEYELIEPDDAVPFFDPKSLKFSNVMIVNNETINMIAETADVGELKQLPPVFDFKVDDKPGIRLTVLDGDKIQHFYLSIWRACGSQPSALPIYAPKLMERIGEYL